MRSALCIHSTVYYKKEFKAKDSTNINYVERGNLSLKCEYINLFYSNF